MHCINFEVWFFGCGFFWPDCNFLVVVDVGSVDFGIGAVLFPAIDYLLSVFSSFFFFCRYSGWFLLSCSLFP